MQHEKFFLETSPLSRLCVKVFRPVPAPLDPKEPIVMVHGLANSSELFDTLGLEDLSFVKTFLDHGYQVYTYDQRGAGESEIKDWDFGLRENAFVDLPQVLKFTLSHSGAQRVILGGYSLGGLIIYCLYSYLNQYPNALAGLAPDRIARIFCMTSPGSFHVRTGRWSKLFVRGQKAWGKTGSFIDRNQFVYGQIAIASPFLGWLLRPSMIGLCMKIAQQSTAAAALIKALPLPSLLFARSDLDAKTFRALLRSKVLDRTSSRIFSDLFTIAAHGGEIDLEFNGRRIRLPEDFVRWGPIPLFLVSSDQDELVLSSEVDEVAKRVPAAVHYNVDLMTGDGCGHAGYLFKKRLTHVVRREILSFLNAGRGR